MLDFSGENRQPCLTCDFTATTLSLLRYFYGHSLKFAFCCVTKPHGWTHLWEERVCYSLQSILQIGQGSTWRAEPEGRNWSRGRELFWLALCGLCSLLSSQPRVCCAGVGLPTVGRACPCLPWMEEMSIGLPTGQSDGSTFSLGIPYSAWPCPTLQTKL